MIPSKTSTFYLIQQKECKSITDKEDAFRRIERLSQHYNQHLVARLQDTTLYSILFLICFLSPLVIVSLYYCYKSRDAILKSPKDDIAELYLNRAHYINLVAFVVGVLAFFAYFCVSIILISIVYKDCK